MGWGGGDGGGGGASDSTTGSIFSLCFLYFTDCLTLCYVLYADFLALYIYIFFCYSTDFLGLFYIFFVIFSLHFIFPTYFFFLLYFLLTRDIFSFIAFYGFGYSILPVLGISHYISPAWFCEPSISPCIAYIQYSLSSRLSLSV